MNIGDLVCISPSCHFKTIPPGSVALVVGEIKANETALMSSHAKTLSSMRESKYYFVCEKKVYGPVYEWELTDVSS